MFLKFCLSIRHKSPDVKFNIRTFDVFLAVFKYNGSTATLQVARISSTLIKINLVRLEI